MMKNCKREPLFKSTKTSQFTWLYFTCLLFNEEKSLLMPMPAEPCCIISFWMEMETKHNTNLLNDNNYQLND